MLDTVSAPALRFELPRVVDSTMCDSFRICPQRFSFAHGFGLAEPEKSVHLVAGGAFAAARRALYASSYSGLSRPDALSTAKAAFLAEWGDFELPADSKSPKTLARTWELLRDYADTFDPPRDQLAPARHLVDPPFEWPFRVTLEHGAFGVERWPLHPSGQPFVYAGRLDALVCAGGLTIVLDDKSTSRFTAVDTWVASLQMRAQLIGYVAVVRMLLDATCDSVVVRQGAMRTTGVEWRESPLIPMPQALLRRWAETTCDTLTRMVECDERGAFPPVLSDACVSWSRPCAYLEACRSSEPAKHLEGFTERRWNPLTGSDIDD